MPPFIPHDTVYRPPQGEGSAMLEVAWVQLGKNAPSVILPRTLFPSTPWT